MHDEFHSGVDHRFRGLLQPPSYVVVPRKTIANHEARVSKALIQKFLVLIYLTCRFPRDTLKGL